MIPIVYRWDDANAPVARGERRSLCDILRACLVDGYGEKPAAGWTMEYINVTEDKAAFRNNPVTGTGFYLQVNGETAPNDYMPIVRGYEEMTSVDDGLFGFSCNSYAWTSTGANTTQKPWILIADDLAFYFFCWPNSSSSGIPPNDQGYCLYFGDLTGTHPDDHFACGHTTGKASYYFTLGYMYGGETATCAGDYGIAFPRKADGSGSPFIGCMGRGGGPGDSQIVGRNGISYVPDGPLILSKPYMNDGSGYSFRGYFPGLWNPCHPRSFAQLEEVSKDGRSFVSVRGNMASTSYPGNLLISLDDWRA